MAKIVDKYYTMLMDDNKVAILVGISAILATQLHF